MNTITAYLAEVELALVSSPIISEYHCTQRWANTDDGYIRFRATLANSDFLEAAEYFVFDGQQVITVDYRYQWMDGTKTILRRRWDSTPHHPDLENYPYHLHIDNEETVIASDRISVIELLAILPKLITETTR
jgi:hypothetical protein